MHTRETASGSTGTYINFQATKYEWRFKNDIIKERIYNGKLVHIEF